VEYRISTVAGRKMLLREQTCESAQPLRTLLLSDIHSLSLEPMNATTEKAKRPRGYRLTLVRGTGKAMQATLLLH
jgi:hypothetical protein